MNVIALCSLITTIIFNACANLGFKEFEQNNV
ncbi:hypothetical protein MBGDC06_00533 [Thermoplasmatales archaeon SCGC AB-539-C06]|nr:hypothetical protein MBGDC06_00533 [Thermoplasmatales archaeon SCGC AB-539-C06]